MGPTVWFLGKIATLGGIAAQGIGLLGTALGNLPLAPILGVAAAVASIAYALPKMIEDLRNWTEPEAIEEYEKYLESPWKWEEEQLKQREWRQYQKEMELRYPEAAKAAKVTSAERFKSNVEEFAGQEAVTERSEWWAAPININITGNNINDMLDIDEIGDKLIERLKHAGITK